MNGANMKNRTAVLAVLVSLTGACGPTSSSSGSSGTVTRTTRTDQGGDSTGASGSRPLEAPAGSREPEPESRPTQAATSETSEPAARVPAAAEPAPASESPQQASAAPASAVPQESPWGRPETESGEPLPERRPLTGSARDAYRRGMEASSRGDNAGAQAAFQEALSADSTSFRAAYNLGVLADRAGQADQALNFYRQALRVQPDYERAVEGVVRIYVRQGRASDAVSFAQPIAQRWVRNLAVQAVYGDALVAANRSAEAVDAARAALRRDERFVPAMIVMAKANLRLGRNELAQSILEQALAIDATNAEGHFLRGQMYEAEHQLQPAITSYRRAIELSRDYADARMRLGILMLGGANYDEAVQQFEAVARLVPDLMSVHLNLGDAYRSTKQWTKAKAEFDTVSARSPSTVEVHYNLGLMFWSQAMDLTGQEQLDMLVRAQQELTTYRTGMGSRLPRDDQSTTFIEDLNRQIDRARRVIERDAARRQREAERAARQSASGGGDSAGGDSAGGTP